MADKRDDLDVANISTIMGASGRGEDQIWKQWGLCYGNDPNIWYPERGEDVRPAKAICNVCPVRRACLAYALRTGERLGIWGGRTERERRRLRRGLTLSITCRYCSREVKAAGLKQVWCNRAECIGKAQADGLKNGSAPPMYTLVWTSEQLEFVLDVPMVELPPRKCTRRKREVFSEQVALVVAA